MLVLKQLIGVLRGICNILTKKIHCSVRSKVYIRKTKKKQKRKNSRQKNTVFSHLCRHEDETHSSFGGDVTPLTPQITTKAQGDRETMSVCLRKLAFMRQPQHTYTQKHMYAHSCKRYGRGVDTGSKRHAGTDTSCLRSALHPDIGVRLIHAVPNHLVVWWLTHSHMTMHWFLFFPPPLPSSSAGCADGAAWRNPLSRHFSFPLTDRPWRAQAFGPPAWLAARQLNKLSSCYNSLKHFQLPQSNISHRRALGCFSTSNPTPQRVLFPPIVWFIWRSPMLQWRGRVFLDKSERARQWGEIGGYKPHGTDNREMILRFASGVFQNSKKLLEWTGNQVLLTLSDSPLLQNFNNYHKN